MNPTPPRPALALAPQPPPIDLPIAFDPISFGAEIIGSFLAALFTSIFGGGPSAQQLQGEINNLASSVGQAIDTLKRFTWTVAFGLGSVLNALWSLIKDFLSKIWELLKKLAQDVAKLVKEALPKIMDAIRKIRQIMRDLYAKYIRVVLLWIQYARKYLAILRIFHVKWAAKLDGYLQTLQARIIGPYLYVLRTLNGVGNWVNLIVTAGGVIQRAVFINTMYAYQSDWINMWWQAQQVAPASGPASSPPAVVVAPAPADVQAEFAATAGYTTGAYADQAQQARTDLRAAFGLA